MLAKTDHRHKGLPLLSAFICENPCFICGSCPTVFIRVFRVIRGSSLLRFAASMKSHLDYSGPIMLSAVIPVWNETESLSALHAELADVARQHAYDLEIIFVDDGSTDGSWQQIEQLAAADARVRGIRFRR